MMELAVNSCVSGHLVLTAVALCVFVSVRTRMKVTLLTRMPSATPAHHARQRRDASDSFVADAEIKLSSSITSVSSSSAARSGALAAAAADIARRDRASSPAARTSRRAAGRASTQIGGRVFL